MRKQKPEFIDRIVRKIYYFLCLQEKECEHEWVNIHTGETDIKKYIYFSSDLIRFEKYEKKKTSSSLGSMKEESPQNKVCIKCGECDNQVEYFEKMYLLQKREEMKAKKESRRKKALAIQIWLDNEYYKKGGSNDNS